MNTPLHPPGPRSRPALGSILAFRRDPLDHLLQAASRYGDLTYFSRRNSFLLSHPDHIEDVLVSSHRNFHKGQGFFRNRLLVGQGLLTSEDGLHRRQRRLVQPAFHRQRLTAYAPVMAEYAAQARERWRDGATVDIAREMRQLSLAIVGRTLFNTDVEPEAEEIGEALIIAMRWLNPTRPRLVALLQKLLPVGERRFERARARLDATVYRLIEEHRAAGEDRGDVLSSLLLARDEEGDGPAMTEAQVRDEAMTLLLAGHETVTNALTWTWYLLAQHPQVEAKLHAELDTVLGGRLPTVGDLPHLRYTRMVFTEAMRLYPPVPLITRQALGDHRVEDYVVPAGSTVVLSQYVTHRDPRYYPDPSRFDPERWTPEAEAQRPKFAYFPFGGGPRSCIGEPFAWMEAVLILATLAQRWQMRLARGHRVAFDFVVTLRAKGGIPMVLTRRRDAPGH